MFVCFSLFSRWFYLQAGSTVSTEKVGLSQVCQPSMEIERGARRGLEGQGWRGRGQCQPCPGHAGVSSAPDRRAEPPASPSPAVRPRAGVLVGPGRPSTLVGCSSPLGTGRMGHRDRTCPQKVMASEVAPRSSEHIKCHGWWPSEGRQGSRGSCGRTVPHAPPPGRKSCKDGATLGLCCWFLTADVPPRNKR